MPGKRHQGRWAALLLAWLMPLAVLAQPMDCVDTVARDPRLAPVARALDATDALFPALREALAASVGHLCLAQPPLGAQGYFEPATRRLVLSADLPEGLMQAVFFHELRHAQQFASGSCPAPELAMQDHAQAVFAMEADASVSALVIADALRQQGEAAMWQALAAWPMQADIALAYDSARDDGQGIAQAAAAAFDAWYAGEERREAYYVAACMDYLDKQDREHRLPRYDSLDPGFFDGLCVLPDGAAYACAPRP
ncbi:DUF6782 family putative metallopeptidase [Thetidibacter halocola]|uniref:DUF6782 domain-containing protein n=1 Tax=Thetidibacter halocola TaxID=2827239 RepID=A0A8J7WJJ7_9RHOB|nr:DUF6782 family putative metallopeptidase [Thetidibacter halocola]MBS0126223.1 hypothetical protein [Thetidibacter halocola]